MASAPFSSWKPDDRAEVDVGEHVARDDEEPLVELVAGVQHRAGRPERGLLGRVDHAHAELGAVAEVRADRVGHEGDGDDDLAEAVLAQQEDDVLHHRPVGHRQHRLGLVGGERAQAGALTARHDHRLHAGTPVRRGWPRRPTAPGPASAARAGCDVGGRGDPGQREPGSAGHPGEVPDGRPASRPGRGRAGRPGRRTSARRCPALPTHRTSMRAAPRAARSEHHRPDQRLAAEGERRRTRPARRRAR